VSRFGLNVGPLGLDIGRLGNIRLSLGWFGGHVCSSLASFGQSLPEEGVEDDAERNNNGAEPEDQDIADIMSGNARASLGRRDDGSVCPIIRCHFGISKKRGAPVSAGAPDAA
jgi:hypothetical protein